jgi:hypothetical protein
MFCQSTMFCATDCSCNTIHMMDMTARTHRALPDLCALFTRYVCCCVSSSHALKFIHRTLLVLKQQRAHTVVACQNTSCQFTPVQMPTVCSAHLRSCSRTSSMSSRACSSSNSFLKSGGGHTFTSYANNRAKFKESTWTAQAF